MDTKSITPVSIWTPNRSHLYLYGHQTNHTCIYMDTKPITPVSIWTPIRSHLYLYGHQTDHTCIYMDTKPITPVSIWTPNQSHLYLYGHQNQSHLYLYRHQTINLADNKRNTTVFNVNLLPYPSPPPTHNTPTSFGFVTINITLFFSLLV